MKAVYRCLFTAVFLASSCHCGRKEGEIKGSGSGQIDLTLDGKLTGIIQDGNFVGTRSGAYDGDLSGIVSGAYSYTDEHGVSGKAGGVGGSVRSGTPGFKPAESDLGAAAELANLNQFVQESQEKGASESDPANINKLYSKYGG